MPPLTLQPHIGVTVISKYLHVLAQRGGSLKSQVLRGSLWLFFGHGLNRVAGFIKLLVLARLLTPADFGLVGIAMLLVRWFEQFSQTGFRQALVRTPGDIEPYLNTLWTVQIIRGLVMSTALLAAAPLAARFFDQPGALLVIQALAPLIVLRSLVNPATVYLARDLDFQRLAAWHSCQAIAGLLVAIPLALWYRNVWALIWPLLIGQLVHMLVPYRMHPFRPRLALNRAYARELARFGKWIFCKNVLNALIGSVDSIAIGKLAGAAALGGYQVVMRVATLPSHLLIQVLPHVTFPAFAKLEQPQQWRQAYLQLLPLVLLLALPVTAVMCVFPHLLVQGLLGEQWLAMAPLLQLLAVYGSLQALLDVARPMFEAVGRPDLQVKLQGAEVMFSVVLIPILTLYGGLEGAAGAVVLVHVLLLGLQFGMLRNLIHLSLVEGLSTWRQGTLVALPIAGLGLMRPHVDPAIYTAMSCLVVVGCAALLWMFLQRHLAPLRQINVAGKT